MLHVDITWPSGWAGLGTGLTPPKTSTSGFRRVPGAVLCCAVLCCAVLCCAVLCCARDG